jgi:hypothetical protein
VARAAFVDDQLVGDGNARFLLTGLFVGLCHGGAAPCRTAMPKAVAVSPSRAGDDAPKGRVSMARWRRYPRDRTGRPYRKIPPSWNSQAERLSR